MTVQCVNTLADLVALSTIGACSAVVKGRNNVGDGYEGLFVWDGGDKTSSVNADAQQAIWVAPGGDTSGASGAWKREGGTPSIFWWDVLGDGSHDDTAGIQAMYDRGFEVYLPRRRPDGANATYFVTAPIVMDRAGGRISGECGGAASTIMADDFDGPVIDIQHRRNGVFDIVIDSNLDRQGMDFDWGRCGIRLGFDGPVNTNCTLERVSIYNQPGCGIEKLRTGSLCRFEQITVQDCCGHGVYGGDGATQGLAIDRPGIWQLVQPRIHHNGGNAVCLDESGHTHLRVTIDDGDCGNNCWNFYDATSNPGGIPDLKDTQFFVRGQNLRLLMVCTADTEFEQQPIPKTERSSGIYVAAPSNHVQISGKGRLMNVSPCVDVEDGCYGIDVELAYHAYGDTEDDGDVTQVPVPIGVRFGENCIGTVLIDRLYKGGDVNDPVYVTPVRSGAGSTIKVIAEGLEYRAVPGTNGLFAMEGARESTVNSSGALNVLAAVVRVSGDGDAADDIDNINQAGGSNPLPDGRAFTLVNDNAYHLNLRHNESSTGNIRLIGGRDKRLNPGEAVQFMADAGLVYEIGGLQQALVNGGPLTKTTLDTAFTFSGTSLVTVLTASITVPAAGWYPVSAAAHINHRDNAATTYYVKLFDGSTLIDKRRTTFSETSAISRPLDIQPTWVFLTAGAHTITLQAQQLTYSSVYGQVQDDADGVSRATFIEVGPAR